jgi:hypothetical protein
MHGCDHIYYPLANKITSIGLEGVEGTANLETPERHCGRDEKEEEEKRRLENGIIAKLVKR